MALSGFLRTFALGGTGLETIAGVLDSMGGGCAGVVTFFVFGIMHGFSFKGFEIWIGCTFGFA